MKQNTKNVSSRDNDGRNTYVTEHITDALLMLLKEKKLADISISELTDKAGVGRVSFYRNYKSKEDIIKKHMLMLFEEWTQQLQSHPDAPLSEQIRTMIAHFERHRDFYNILNKNGLTYLLKDVFIELIGPKPECEMAQAYASAYVVYTMYGWIDVWFQRGMKETSDELAALFKGQGL